MSFASDTKSQNTPTSAQSSSTAEVGPSKLLENSTNNPVTGGPTDSCSATTVAAASSTGVDSGSSNATKVVSADTSTTGANAEASTSNGINTAPASTTTAAAAGGISDPPSGGKKNPICVLVLGMAGAGKTNVVKRLSTQFACTKRSFHTVNLDPAVKTVPYVPYIDIRDTINYKEIMNQYGLGPNGGIVTSLNLFSTMFDDVLKLIAKREDDLEYILFDTPGQIEVFNWSASGPIIAGALASVYPTIIVYVVDTVRSNNTQTFMANMVYACSILYKYKLPFVIAFNKIDITDCKFAFDWMRDFEAFQDVVAEESTFSSNLTRSLSLALEEFYCNIKASGVSSVTGEGMAELVDQMDAAAVEYEDYRAEYEQLKAEKEKLKQKEQQQAKVALHRDLQPDAAKSLKKIRRNIKDETEVLIGMGESDSDGSGEELDEDDTEETREGESFQGFLRQQQERHLQQQQQQQNQKQQQS